MTFGSLTTLRDKLRQIFWGVAAVMLAGLMVIVVMCRFVWFMLTDWRKDETKPDDSS